MVYPSQTSLMPINLEHSQAWLWSIHPKHISKHKTFPFRPSQSVSQASPTVLDSILLSLSFLVKINGKNCAFVVLLKLLHFQNYQIWINFKQSLKTFSFDLPLYEFFSFLLYSNTFFEIRSADKFPRFVLRIFSQLFSLFFSSQIILWNAVVRSANFSFLLQAPLLRESISMKVPFFSMTFVIYCLGIALRYLFFLQFPSKLPLFLESIL